MLLVFAVSFFCASEKFNINCDVSRFLRILLRGFNALSEPVKLWRISPKAVLIFLKNIHDFRYYRIE